MYCSAGRFANASGSTMVIGLAKRIITCSVEEFWKA